MWLYLAECLLLRNSKHSAKYSRMSYVSREIHTRQRCFTTLHCNCGAAGWRCRSAGSEGETTSAEQWKAVMLNDAHRPSIFDARAEHAVYVGVAASSGTLHRRCPPDRPTDWPSSSFDLDIRLRRSHCYDRMWSARRSLVVWSRWREVWLKRAVWMNTCIAMLCQNSSSAWCVGAVVKAFSFYNTQCHHTPIS